MVNTVHIVKPNLPRCSCGIWHNYQYRCCHSRAENQISHERDFRYHILQNQAHLYYTFNYVKRCTKIFPECVDTSIMTGQQQSPQLSMCNRLGVHQREDNLSPKQVHQCGSKATTFEHARTRKCTSLCEMKKDKLCVENFTFVW
jgi:hypothetical protein